MNFSELRERGENMFTVTARKTSKIWPKWKLNLLASEKMGNLNLGTQKKNINNANELPKQYELAHIVYPAGINNCSKLQITTIDWCAEHWTLLMCSRLKRISL